jgi:hypothetical protein
MKFSADSFLICLLQTRFQTTFEKYVTPELLYKGVLFFFAITFTLVLITYLYLGLKKKAFFFKDRIKKSLELWISNVILNEDEAETIEVPEKFRKMFHNPQARQYAIDNLISNKKAFSGAVAINIKLLYEQLGFKADSLKKLNNKAAYTKARGVYELSMMDQNEHLIQIYRLTNSKDELVRTEAQTAIIQWSGFNGLRFLDVTTHAISEWQQIKLLEQLKNFIQEDMPKLSKWLASKNDTVVIFALKLVEAYQQFHVVNKVAECLSYKNEAVRIQAVNSLVKIGDEEVADILVIQYEVERFTNKINILNKFSKVANAKHISFLEKELDNENDFLKLEAAKVIGELGRMDILERKAMKQPEPFAKIYGHVNSELAI